MSEKILEFFAALPRELYVFVVSLFPIVELRGSIPLGAGLGMPFYTNYLLSVLGNLLPVPFILLFISGMLDFLARFRMFRPIVNWLRRKADKHSGRVLGDNGSSSEKIDTPVPLAEKLSTETEDSLTVSDVSLTAAEDTGESLTLSAEGEDALSSETNISAPPSAIEAQDGNDITGETKQKKKRGLTPGIFTALLLFVAIPLPGTGAWTGSLVASLFNLPKRSSFLAIALGVMLSGVIMCLASYGVVGFLKIFI